MIRLKYDKSILLPSCEVVARGSANWENDAHLERHARTSVVHCNSQIQAMLENNCSYSEVLQLVLSPIKSLPKVPHKVLHLTPPTALVKYNLKCKSKLMYILTDERKSWLFERECIFLHVFHYKLHKQSIFHRTLWCNSTFPEPSRNRTF